MVGREMTNTEILRTLSRMMAALREHAPVGEVTFESNGWKMCDRLNIDGSVTNLYMHKGEPDNLFPLKVTLFTLGRSYVTTIQSEKELCPA
jgi:hypothetical protein